MSGWIIAHEALLRGSAFAAVFVLVAIAETIVEARPLRVARRARWTQNLTLTLLNSITLRLLFPLGATAAAIWSDGRAIGLLRLVSWPPLLEVAIAIALLDLTIYGQHVLLHAVPVLFRFHQIHHADVDFDVTLGARFHPIEMLLSMVIKLSAVVVIGASAATVVLFETLLAVTSLFNHGNLRLPRAVDRALRWVVVTPAMHVVHHSPEPSDRNTNFGFNIPWWDHLFGTYRERSSADPRLVGMPDHQFDIRQNVRWMLMLPFRPTRPGPTSRVHTHQEAA